MIRQFEGAMHMGSPNMMSKIAGAAVLLALAGLMGCSDDDSSSGAGGGGAGAITPLNWVSTSNPTAGTAGANGDTPLIWVDPNLGPTNTGGGGQGDKTFTTVDPITWPVGSLNGDHPVVVMLALNSNEELSIEGQAFIYRASLINGGFGGGGGGGVIVVLPGLYGNQAKLQQVGRAICKHYLIHTPTEMGLGALLGFGLAANNVAGGNSEVHLVLPAANLDAATAWNYMGNAVQQRVQQGGYMGGGYWATATMESYDLIFTTSIP